MFILKDVTYKDILHIPYLQIQKRKNHMYYRREWERKKHIAPYVK